MIMGRCVVCIQADQVAMGLYYAEQSFSLGPGGGLYTDDLVKTPDDNLLLLPRLLCCPISPGRTVTQSFFWENAPLPQWSL